MAEFLEVARQWGRICKANGDDCDGCVLRAPGGILTCRVYAPKQPERFEKTVMAWAAEHPEKTMLDVFYEKFPRAERLSNGAVRICPYHLEPDWGGLCDDGKGNKCRECWRRPVEEGENNGKG